MENNLSSLLVRPVKTEDIDQLYELSGKVTVGLTTLPHDRKVLQKRIKASVRSFSEVPEKPGGEIYLFVMEDTKTRQIVGTSALFSKVGGFQPFYTYKIHTVTKESKILNVKLDIQYLQLIEDHNGPSEVGTLFLTPDYRKSGNGRLLSLSRFLFMAQFRNCFENTVLAEMRGVFNENGHSPFWDALGKHFFLVEFAKADLMVMQDKSFIAELMPKHPIYIPLLTPHAQEVIGKVHQDTEGAKHLLESEGFRYNGEIDIFEAGPVLSSPVDSVRSVKDSRLATVSNISDHPPAGLVYLLANVSNFQNFRVTKGTLKKISDGEVEIGRSSAELLNLKPGSQIRYVPIKKVE
jgi:arginine N-succinyltransferase